MSGITVGRLGLTDFFIFFTFVGYLIRFKLCELFKDKIYLGFEEYFEGRVKGFFLFFFVNNNDFS